MKSLSPPPAKGRDSNAKSSCNAKNNCYNQSGYLVLGSIGNKSYWVRETPNPELTGLLTVCLILSQYSLVYGAGIVK